MKSSKYKIYFYESIAILLIVVFSIIFWDSILVFPIKLLVVIFHEISHGIAAILTGGKVISLDIGLDLGGKCTIEGGNSFIIASSGYLGSFLIGAIIFYSAYNFKFGKLALPTIAIITILFAINKSSNEYLPLILIGISIIFFLLYKFVSKNISAFILKLVGFINCIYVIVDIREDIFSNSVIISDATILANISGISEYFWGILFLIMSVSGLFFLVKVTIKEL